MAKRFRAIARIAKNVRTGKWLLFFECGHRSEVTLVRNKKRGLCRECGDGNG